MKRSLAIVTGLLAAVVASAPVSAGPPYTGDTKLLNAPISGETLWVEATVFSEGPVVAYEIAIQNECKRPARGGSTIQRDDIIYWLDENEDGRPEAVMPIYLQSIPAGSSCKVFLMRGGTTLKGSATSYTVAAAP
jgi:hypothetical protein